MLDCLSTIEDQFADSVGLPAKGHAEKLRFLSREKSTVF